MSSKVIVLGGSGMLGSMVTDVLSRDPDIELTATVRSETLTDQCRAHLSSVRWVLFDAEAADLDAALRVIDGHEWVINTIGLTKPYIHEESSFEVERAIRVNALLPHRLARRAEACGARVLQPATDGVFSGAKGHYVETDPHDAFDVYGKTKSLGEVISLNVSHLRCSVIGPEPKSYGFLVEWFRSQPPDARINGYVNHLWNGVTTFHFARICLGIIRVNLPLPSLQHVIPDDDVSKADILRLLSTAYGRTDVSIHDVEAERAGNFLLRTNDEALNRSIWEAAGYERPLTVAEMIPGMARHDCRLEGLVNG
ncbi:MAG: sugar nucleotide-binding protein [Nitrospinota bacterium]|nr:sugar nucleotide-binding protein [Nitrospinota bacterium]